jgi:hypothetical protein
MLDIGRQAPALLLPWNKQQVYRRDVAAGWTFLSGRLAIGGKYCAQREILAGAQSVAARARGESS